MTPKQASEKLVAIRDDLVNLVEWVLRHPGDCCGSILEDLTNALVLIRRHDKNIDGFEDEGEVTR